MAARMPVYEVLPKSNHAYLLEVVKTIEKLSKQSRQAYTFLLGSKSPTGESVS